MDSLLELERSVPVASDQALINLVNGIVVTKDMVKFQSSQGYISRLFQAISGSGTKVRALIDGNLIESQEILHELIVELAEKLSMSQTALRITQHSLIKSKNKIHNNKEKILEVNEKMCLIEDRFNFMISDIDNAIVKANKKIQMLEADNRAFYDYERIFNSWEAKLTYQEFPWFIQIFMLIRELYCSSILWYEKSTGDISKYRILTLNRILKSDMPLKTSFFSLYDIIDNCCKNMDGHDNIDLAIDIINISSAEYHHYSHIPIAWILSNALEMSLLPKSIRPLKPGRCSFEMYRNRIKRTEYTTDLHELIQLMIDEISRYYSYLLST